MYANNQPILHKLQIFDVESNIDISLENPLFHESSGSLWKGLRDSEGLLYC